MRVTAADGGKRRRLSAESGLKLNVLEAKTDKYEWLRYFKEYRNISGLNRATVVELIDRVRVLDKNHIEVDFAFDDCFRSALRQVQSAGCTVSTGEDGRMEIVRREVV